MKIEEFVSEFLVCPECKGRLEYKKQGGEESALAYILVCPNCQVYYSIKDGIPILLVEEAGTLNPGRGR